MQARCTRRLRRGNDGHVEPEESPPHEQSPQIDDTLAALLSGAGVGFGGRAGDSDAPQASLGSEELFALWRLVSPSGTGPGFDDFTDAVMQVLSLIHI